MLMSAPLETFLEDAAKTRDELRIAPPVDGAVAYPPLSDATIIRRLEQTEHTHPQEIGCRVGELRDLLKEIQRLRHECEQFARDEAALQSESHKWATKCNERDGDMLVLWRIGLASDIPEVSSIAGKYVPEGMPQIPYGLEVAGEYHTPESSQLTQRVANLLAENDRKAALIDELSTENGRLKAAFIAKAGELARAEEVRPMSFAERVILLFLVAAFLGFSVFMIVWAVRMTIHR